MATINENGDVLVQTGPLTFKVRSEEIVIRNQDPANKRVDVYESARLMTGDAMGAPMVNRLHSVPVDADFAATTINGITGEQILTWIATWAATINAVDADDMVKQITG